MRPLVFDDCTIASFVSRATACAVPPRIQLALVSWFVNDVRIDDAEHLYAWFNDMPGFVTH